MNIFRKNKKTRVLSLDGGGVKGLYEAKLLDLISKEFKVNLLDYFDYFVGSSAGSIVAAATALGVDSEKVLEQFANIQEALIKDDLLLGIYRSRYKADGLAKIIRDKAKTTTFGELEKKLLILAVNLQTGKGKIFGSTEHDKDLPIADAVIASSSAPIFFPPHKIRGKYYTDGSLWAANPTMIALMQLLKEGKKPDDIAVLSIGTGFTNKKATLFEEDDEDDDEIKPVKDWGLMRWNLKLFNLMLKLQTDKADYIADTILAPKSYVRLDFTTEEPIELDSFKDVNLLLRKAEETFHQDYNSIKSFFETN